MKQLLENWRCIIISNLNYEELFERSISRISSEVAKFEGTLLYDAIVPCVMELWEAYLAMHELIKRVYADTAYNEYLEARCKERGIYRKEAIKAIRLARFNIDVPVGSRWTKEELVYTVIENLDNHNSKVECDVTGAIGNHYTGEMKNMDGIEGVTYAELTDVIVAGEDVEDDESLRKRYFSSFEPEAFGGNVKDYQEKVKNLSGVGQVKVFPVWNGGGTVKLLLLNNDNDIPSDVLISEVQTKVDPVQNQGEGLGLAPIGHVVTVESATKNIINVSFKVILKSGLSFENIKEELENVISDYFKNLRKTWSEIDNIIVRISQIESKVLDLPGVLDVYDTKLNNNMSNLSLNDYEVPFLGEVSSYE